MIFHDELLPTCLKIWPYENSLDMDGRKAPAAETASRRA
jgi:hypothetical protein